MTDKTPSDAGNAPPSPSFRSLHGRAPTIHDVAAVAGVSARTVSRVLNKSSKVNEETRKTVEKIFADIGFSPNSRARGLPSGKSYLIGLIQDEPNAHIIGLVQEGIARAARDAGYELVVHPAHFRDPGLSNDIRDFVQRSRVDGVIILPPISELVDLPVALRQWGIPAVAIAATPISGYPFTVVSKERLAAREMAHHFVELGHENIALLTGPADYCSSRERSAGFREALSEHRITLSGDAVLIGDYSFASGLDAGERILNQPSPPTAIFACNDKMAAGVMKAALSRGLSVPQDISIGGFDDSEIAVMLSPALTTIQRPVLNNAITATEQLLLLIDGETAPAAASVHVDLSLVMRQSTGPALHRDNNSGSRTF